MKRVIQTQLVIVLAVAFCTLLVGYRASAGEFRFIAGQVVEGRAIWEPSMVLIDQDEDLKGGVVFVLENPSKIEHAFAVRGLYELVTEKGAIAVEPGVDVEQMNYSLRPIRVTVGAGDTKRIKVSTAELSGDRNVGQHFRYFCPIHKDVHVGGSVFVVK